MAILDTVKGDVQGAMRAGEKERVSALRLVLSELQKAVKEGSDDELAVLRRERKRRLEAARAYREAGRDDLADGEEAEARLIGSYLPAELSDEELREIVERAVRESGAESVRDMGAAMGSAMAAVDGRAEGGRVSGLVKAALGVRAALARGQRMRTQIELPNDVAAELAGSQDAVLRALEAHLQCRVFLRGNLITFDGEQGETRVGERVVRELSDLIARGHQIGPGTIAAVTGALDAHESPAQVLEDVVWRHRSLQVAPKTVNQKRYVDCIRQSTVTFGIGPAGTGKTFLAVAMAAAALSRHEVNRIILTRPAVEAGERLGFLPGDLMAKVDPYLRPLFDALHDMLDPERGLAAPRAGRDRDRAAGFHAGQNPERLVRDPRRGAEHDARADEDVPDSPGLWLTDGGNGRRHPGRSAARAAVGADRGGGCARGG